MPLYQPATTAVTDATISTSDITTNNASTSKHGFLKKLSNVSTEYMSGTGVYSTPAGASLPWFDVTTYGAVHDGTTDDTVAVQAAITACMAAGGGTVFFPNGIYAIKGALQSTTTYNSQLKITQNVYSGGSNGPVAIAFVGMGPAGQWNHGTSGPWLPGSSGAILLSNWAGTISGFPAVIAAGKYDAVYPAASFNWIEVTFRNIEIRTPANPKLSGIQMAAVASLTCENVTVATDTDSASMVLPSNANAYGIHCPLKINVNPPGIFYNVFVDGFYTGVLIAEVFHGMNLSVHHCNIGIQCDGPQNHGAQIDTVWFIAVKYGLYFTGGLFYINVANWRGEFKNSGTFALVADVYDPSNYARGFISQHVQEYGGTGGATDLVFNGGAGLSGHWVAKKRWKLNDTVLIPAATANPSDNPASGRIIYTDNSTGHLSARTPAGSVIDLESAVATDTIWDAAGDLAVGSGADTAAKLAKGSDSTVLTISASTHLPVWAAPAGGANVAVDTLWDAAGDLVQGTGADTAAKLSAGTSGYVLTSNGPAAALSWQAAGGGGGSLANDKVLRTAGDVTTTSTSFTDLTGATITLTTGAHRCLVAFSCTVTHSTNGTMGFDILVDGTRIGAAATHGLGFRDNYPTGGAQSSSPVSIVIFTDALSAGSHTIKVQWKVSSGTGTVYANTTTAAMSFAVTELAA